MTTETKRPLDIDHDTEVVQAHYDLLARAVTIAEMGDDHGWQDQFFSSDTKFIAATRDPLARFDGSAWREASGRQDLEIDGHPCIHWSEVQATKGQARGSITIVDLGGIRLIYQVG